MKKLLAIFIGVVVFGALGIATANFWLDPLNYSSWYHRKVAQEFEAGKNFAIYDPTIDYRGLRREHIRVMARAPDVMLFSGSRFELVGPDLFPGRTFYNAFVQRDYFDDMMAITDILESNNRLPKNLIMSIRYVTFRPHEKRPEGYQWKMFIPEAAAMARKLNVEPPSTFDHFPWGHWIDLFSVPRLTHQLTVRLNDKGEGMRAVTASQLPDMDVLRADGSMSFSVEHSKAFTPEAARKGSAKKAADDSSKPITAPDPKLLAQYKALLEYLTSKGVNVAIAVTPQHPAYWNAVVETPYGTMLKGLEDDMRRLTTAAGAQFVGGFDPGKANCSEAEFRDFIHVGNDCLKNVFDQIKLKN